MKDYKFTQDWFSWSEENWRKLRDLLPERKAFLEVGSYEGRSTVWTVEFMMEDGGVLTAVDTWEGGEEHTSVGEPMDVVEENFSHNIALVAELFPSRRVLKKKCPSVDALALEISAGSVYDFIYIDGSHVAKDVMTDACMAFQLLKTGGIMVFDDYFWGNTRDILHRPKIAIDAFVNLFSENIATVFSQYQYAIMKV